MEKEFKKTTNLAPPLGVEGLEVRVQIKVCGMRDSQNIQELSLLKPDFMGFIFYQNSKRFVGNQLNINILNQIPAQIKKVGVFVNENLENVISNINKYKLDYAQLHGDETIQFCKSLHNKGIKIIKVFLVDEYFDFSTTKIFENEVELFLFDTKTPEKGGSGKTFNWQILDNYKGNTPFLLAGGIDEHNFETASNIKHKSLFGLDLNSKFETEPGFKDIEQLKKILI